MIHCEGEKLKIGVLKYSLLLTVIASTIDNEVAVTGGVLFAFVPPPQPRAVHDQHRIQSRRHLHRNRRRGDGGQKKKKKKKKKQTLEEFLSSDSASAGTSSSSSG